MFLRLWMPIASFLCLKCCVCEDLNRWRKLEYVGKIYVSLLKPYPNQFGKKLILVCCVTRGKFLNFNVVKFQTISKKFKEQICHQWLDSIDHLKDLTVMIKRIHFFGILLLGTTFLTVMFCLQNTWMAEKNVCHNHEEWKKWPHISFFYWSRRRR